MNARKNWAISVGIIVGVMAGIAAKWTFELDIFVQTAVAVAVGFITMGAMIRRQS